MLSKTGLLGKLETKTTKYALAWYVDTLSVFLQPIFPNECTKWATDCCRIPSDTIKLRYYFQTSIDNHDKPI